MFALSGPRPSGARCATKALQAVGLTAVAALAAGCMATAAPSAPDTVDRDRHEFSADGVTWGGAEVIPWDRSTVPVPGGESNATSFHLRVDGDSAVDGEVYLGDWSIERGSAWFRVDVNGAEGQSVRLDSDAPRGSGVLISEFGIPSGASVLLTLNVGIPSDESAQSARIVPDWGIVLHEKGGSGGGSGSAGSSGSSGSAGSSGSTGSIGSGSIGGSGDAGSSGSSSSLGSLGGSSTTGR